MIKAMIIMMIKAMFIVMEMMITRMRTGLWEADS